MKVPGEGFEPPAKKFSVLCFCINLRRHIKDLTKTILPRLHLRHTEDIKWKCLGNKRSLANSCKKQKQDSVSKSFHIKSDTQR